MPDPGRPQPDPRGQDAPDLLADPDRRRSTACRRWTPRWPASSRDGTDHDGRRRDALRPARRAAQAHRAPARPGLAATASGRLMAATFAYKAVDASGMPAEGRDRRRRPSDAVAEELKARGLTVMEPGREEDRPADGALARAKRVKPAELTVMTRQLATMISSGMTLLRAFYVLEDQVENHKLRDTRQRRPRGHRVRPALLRRARQAPEGLQPALRRDGARRRGRRRARGVARPRRRPAREGRRAAPPGQGRDGLPDRRADVRARRADRPDRVHRPRVRRRSSRTSAASCR